MKSLSLAFLVVALTACGSGENSSQRMRIIEYGIFKKLASTDDVQAPGAIGGARHAVSKVALIECTTNVIARVGTSFGYKAKMPGNSGDVVPCSAKYIHPKLTDPSTGRSSDVEQWDTPGLGGQEDYIGYTFDNSWELVPGSWTIQLFINSNLVVEKTFNVYLPKP